MSGETEQQVSGWTVDTLHTHMQRELDDLQAQIHRRFADMQSHLDERQEANNQRFYAALESQKEAVAKAESASEKRFESVNEFRAQLGDQASRLMARAEAEVRFKNLEDKISSLEARVNVSAGQEKGESGTKAGIYAAIGAAVAILGAIIVVANIVSAAGR